MTQSEQDYLSLLVFLRAEPFCQSNWFAEHVERHWLHVGMVCRFEASGSMEDSLPLKARFYVVQCQGMSGLALCQCLVPL